MAVFTGNDQKGKTQKERIQEITEQLEAGVIAVFESDAYKAYVIDDKLTINFRHTANKEITKISYDSALLIQALKALGKGNISKKDMKRLSLGIPEEKRAQILKETQYTTSWIYEVIRGICNE